MKNFFLLWLFMLTILILGCSDSLSDKRTDNNELELNKNNIIYGPTDANYDIDIQYDNEKHEMTGSLYVEFRNNLDKTLKEVYFNLWPNASEFEGGEIKVSNVKFSNRKVKTKMKDTHLKVFGFSLPDDESGKISMNFTVKVPEMQHRFGWHGTTVSLGNWFPILAVHDANGWHTPPYFAGGESFYSLTSNYDVKLSTDEDMVVAATGNEVESTNKKKEVITRQFKANNVRDFAIQMDSDYLIQTENVDGIKMNVYYTKQHEDEGYKSQLINSGIRSLEIFNEKIGRYGWDELSIVAMDCEFGGMEYPQLIMICVNDQYDEEYINTLVAHEIGHQWFYSAVGNNQYEEPWLDESFSTFMEALGTDRLPYLANEEFKEPEPPYQLNSPVSAFVEKEEQGIDVYSEYIYGYGLKTLNDLRNKLGDKVFYEAMGKYYSEMKYKVSTTSDFINIMENESGEDLTNFFQNHHIEVNKK